MKKLFVFFLITIALTYTCQPPVQAEHLLSFVHSGVQYTAEQAAEPESGYPYAVEDEDDVLYITDDDSGIQAEITYLTLDTETFDMLRDYYNNPALSDTELYSRYVELKKSHVTALEALYNTKDLNNDKKTSETGMRVFFRGTDTLFDVEHCSVYLYNIAQYEGIDYQEQVHLDMIIPARSADTVITIKFTISREQFSDKTSTGIAEILSDLRFKGLSAQQDAPAVFNDESVISAAQLGIFPAPSQEQPVYVEYKDTSAGFSILMPDSYIPYIQNNLGGVLDYISFKIDPVQIFSISSEPLHRSEAIDAITRFKVASYDKIKVHDSGTLDFGDNIYKYLSYTSSDDGIPQYFYDYYIKSEARLYKLQLQCKISEPGSNVKKQFEEILKSFHTLDTNAMDDSELKIQSGTISSLKYLNSEEGYSFRYPLGWRLEEVSPDIAYDKLRLVVPGLSGALDISIQESSLKQIVTFSDVMKSVNGSSISSWSALTNSYNPPFEGKTSKLLYSDFAIDGAISTIYRLSVFMDENGRNRLCYSVDIIKGRKLYSMFITAGEYRTTAGQFDDVRINELINLVADSFRLESTPESEARRISGETRNRKLVFVENYMRRLIDPGLVITSVEKTYPDQTFFVTVGNSADSGYYRIKLDYPNRQVEILGSVLKRNILNNELRRLKVLHGDKIIIGTTQNESKMTLAIESRENLISAKVTRTYQVNISFDHNRISWQTVRLAHQEDYMWECGLYIKSLMPSGTDVFFSGSNVFKDLSPYRQKGLKYRFMTYAQSDNISGFLLLSMDPGSTIFAMDSGLMTMTYVIDNINSKYGTAYSSTSPDHYSFDPETFILTLSSSEDGAKGAVTERFRIFYHLEKGRMDYELVQ